VPHLPHRPSAPGGRDQPLGALPGATAMSLGLADHTARFLHPSPTGRGAHSPGASPLTRLERSAIVSCTVQRAYHGYDVRLHPPLTFRCRSGYRLTDPSAPFNSQTSCP
jgi:hypothetical protein